MGDASEALEGVFNALHGCFAVDTGEQRIEHAGGDYSARVAGADEDGKVFLKVCGLHMRVMCVCVLPSE